MRFIQAIARSLISRETILLHPVFGSGQFNRKISITARKMETKPKYNVVLSQTALNKIVSYKSDLCANRSQPGVYLKQILNTKNVTLSDQTTVEQFIQFLLLTKNPKMYATEEIKVDGSDWNEVEFQILGDLNIAMNVEIYDNGVWVQRDPNFRVHDRPFHGALLFTNGPVLKSRCIKGLTPDEKEIISGGTIDQNKYNGLIERRLMPLFYFANENAKNENTQAFITIPGIGCGVFAGKYRGEMGEHLNQALQNILRKHAKNYNNIACIYFDPFSECTNETHQFGSVSFRVRPSSLNPNKSQLCEPKHYQEAGDDFSNCKLHKIVAWDPVAWPGNSYFKAVRMTDDGVAGTATNSMEILTGIKGTYAKEDKGRLKKGNYYPPDGYRTWSDVVDRHKITLRANGNVKIVTADETLIDLNE